MRYFEVLFEKKKDHKTSVWMIIQNRNNNKVLVAKRSSNVNNPNLWNFFGGGVENNEPIVQAALRELREEAGLKFTRTDINDHGKITFKTKDIYYFVILVDDKIRPTLNKENSKYMWINPKELSKLKLHEPTRIISRNSLNF